MFGGWLTVGFSTVRIGEGGLLEVLGKNCRKRLFEHIFEFFVAHDQFRCF